MKRATISIDCHDLRLMLRPPMTPHKIRRERKLLIAYNSTVHVLSLEDDRHCPA